MKLQHSYEYGNVDYMEAEGGDNTPHVEGLDTIDALAEGSEDNEKEAAKEDTDLIIEDEPDNGEEGKEASEEDTESGEDDTDTELVDQLTPASSLRKAVLKEFPDFFKKFPQYERAYFGNKAYREIFPTLEEAKEASESLEDYKSIETDLTKGSSIGLLKGLKDKNSEAFATMVDNYMDNLRAVDENAYWHLVSNNVKTMTETLVKAAKQTGNEDYAIAGKLLFQYMMGEGTEYTPVSKFAKSKPEELTKLEAEREEFRKSRLTTHQGEIKGKVDSSILSLIERNIDPKESMTSYARKAAVREAQEEVNSLLEKDKDFQKLMSRAYERAEKNNFTSDELLKIRTNYLTKAKLLLPQVIKKIRNEALKGVGQKSANVDRKGPMVKRGLSAPEKSNGGSNDFKDKMKKMSTSEFLNS